MKINILLMIILIIPCKLLAQIQDDGTKNDANVLPTHTDTFSNVDIRQSDPEILSYQNEEDYRQPQLLTSDLYPDSRLIGNGRIDRSETYFNGLLMNDINSNRSFFYTGLNDAFRKSFNSNFETNSNGGHQVDYIASHQSRRSIVDYTHGNQSFRHRIMLAHHSGFMPNGWAYSIAMSAAWNPEGYREGSFVERYSLYFAVSKRLTQKSMLHFFTLTTPATVGGTTSATQEAYDLSSSAYYNPCWGYQNGEKRNVNISRSLLPLWALQYEYSADSNTKAALTIAYQSGYREQSSLDWYNAPDPRADYYKKMPSFYTNDPEAYQPAIAEMIRQQWLNDKGFRQINWDNLYGVNRTNIDQLNTAAGRRSAYVLGADREDIRKINIALSLEKKFNDHVKANTGLTFITQRENNYRKMIDLLGGDYYVNLNQFAEQTYGVNNTMKQIDLDHPGRLIGVGDAYGYHYISRFIKAFLQTGLKLSHNKINAFLSARAGFDGYNREGLYRNGLFPDSSKGKSGNQLFFTYQFNADVVYKISQHQYVRAKATIMNETPTFNNTFISPKTRNSTIEQAETEKVRSFEVGYNLRTARLGAQIAGFATDVNNTTQISRFYHEGYNGFMNYVLQHIDTRQLGIELALKFRLYRNFTLSGKALLMQSFFTSNPDGSFYRDNDTSSQVDHHIAYLKNYASASGPQTLYSLNIQYYLPKQKFRLGLGFNGNDHNYVTLNPMRHISEAIAMLAPGSAKYEAVLQQEKLPDAFTVDVYAGKTFHLQRVLKRFSAATLLNVSCGVNNLLNRKDLRISGSDQLRFDFDSQDPQRFPTKYTYGQGINYFVKCSLEF